MTTDEEIGRKVDVQVKAWFNLLSDAFEAHQAAIANSVRALRRFNAMHDELPRRARLPVSPRDKAT